MRNFATLIILIYVFSFFNSCKEVKQKEEAIAVVKDSLEEKQPKPPKIDSIQVPEGYTKLADVLGNLDIHDAEERVIVYDTPRKVEMGTEREIRVYKLTDKGAWSLWHTSIGAVLPSQHGGMMGDPFEGISIERKCIVIEHFGGSREKWNYTHRYRYQNKQWKLIGASVRNGAPCDFWDYYDYNLSTGRIEVKKEVEDCDDESKNQLKEYTITHKLPELPLMESFYPGNNELKTDKEEDTFYY